MLTVLTDAVGTLYPAETVPGYKAENYDLKDLRAVQQRVYDADGVMVLPSEYKTVLKPGSLVEVDFGLSAYKTVRGRQTKVPCLVSHLHQSLCFSIVDISLLLDSPLLSRPSRCDSLRSRPFPC